MPRGRRSLTDFEHWEQRVISTASKWKGWSITKDQRGRVLIRRREASRPSETVTLPRPIVWEEAYETDIQDWELHKQRLSQCGASRYDHCSYYVGPRGGVYYINSRGRKTYC